jgi:hypothetical protein
MIVKLKILGPKYVTVFALSGDAPPLSGEAPSFSKFLDPPLAYTLKAPLSYYVNSKSIYCFQFD